MEPSTERRSAVGGLQFKKLHRSAGEVLAANANRLRLIEACMICAVPLMLLFLISSMLQGGVAELLSQALAVRVWAVELAFGAFVLLFVFFLLLPLFAGLLWMAARMEAGEETELPELFAPFSSGTAYRAALTSSWSVLWRIGLPIAGGIGIWQGMAWLFAGKPVGGVLAVLLMLPLLSLWLILIMGGFWKPYVILLRTREHERMCPYARSMGFRFWLGWLPWLLLSWLTVGILLLADVLPRMLISYARLCRSLNQTITHSEDIQS